MTSPDRLKKYQSDLHTDGLNPSLFLSGDNDQFRAEATVQPDELVISDYYNAKPAG